jgi:hypothetical protein
MKEKFTSDEWELLKLLPFMVFVLVAAADNKIDEKEKAKLAEDLQKAPFYKDPLHRELGIAILSSDFGQLIRKSMDLSKFKERTDKMKDVLRQKLTHDEYHRFVGSMFINGLGIARASGGGALGLGDKVSDEERRALIAFAAMFEFDVTSLDKHFA